MCQFVKFSLHGSAKTADPFRCDLPLTHTIFSFLPVRKLLTIFRNAFELGVPPSLGCGSEAGGVGASPRITNSIHRERITLSPTLLTVFRLHWTSERANTQYPYFVYRSFGEA